MKTPKPDTHMAVICGGIFYRRGGVCVCMSLLQAFEGDTAK